MNSGWKKNCNPKCPIKEEINKKATNSIRSFTGFLIARFCMNDRHLQGKYGYHVVTDNVTSWIRGQQDAPSPQQARASANGAKPVAAAISPFMSLYCSPPIAHDMNDVQCVKVRPHHRGNCPDSFPTRVWLRLHPLLFQTSERMMKEKRPTAYRHRPMTRSS